MNKILIKNCNLISMDETKNQVEKDIDILIIDDKIERIGKNLEISDTMKIIQAQNKIVMPGLVNAHAHLGMSIFKETSDGYTLQDWLNKVAWPIEAKMTEEDVYILTYMSCIEMIKTGTTTVSNHYFLTNSAIQAELECGMNILETRVLMDNDGKGEERLRELERLINQYRGNPSVNFSIGIHGLYTSLPSYILKAIKMANQYQLPIHMHFCENKKEVEDIKKTYHVNYPAEVLKEYFSNNHLILAHCVMLAEHDMEIMKDLNIDIVHCPVSNLRLGCGIARIKEYMKNGIAICLGTDGQGSGSNMDMFEAMRFAALLQKVKYEDPNAIDAYDILKMGTINGSQALGMSHRGIIKEGNIADVIILDLNEDVRTTPINNIISDIVYNASGHNVMTSIINGTIVMENGQLKNEINEEIVKEKYLAIAKRLFQEK